MSTINQWIRKIHRWLAVPLMMTIIILVAGTVQQGENYISPDWLGALGIASILSLALTGLYMFLQHYLSKWKRASRSKKRITASNDL